MTAKDLKLYHKYLVKRRFLSIYSINSYEIEVIDKTKTDIFYKIINNVINLNSKKSCKFIQFDREYAIVKQVSIAEFNMKTYRSKFADG